ncbi:MAG: hypothetical protein WDO56_05785 [Gammaproteobacteria bacterium]
MSKARIVPEELRKRVAEALAVAVKSYQLPERAVRLGLAAGTAEEANRSKRLYVLNRIDNWKLPQLLKLASSIVEEYDCAELSDYVSELTTHGGQRVSELTRRELLKSTDTLAPLFGDRSGNLIESLDVLKPRWDRSPDLDDFWGSLKDAVEQHYASNEDWSNSQLLEMCGALRCSQARFFGLLEALLHPAARRGAVQQVLAARFSELLKPDGFGANITGHESGHPIFGIQRLSGGVSGQLKNLIFASTGQKPEIVLGDAINNDIIITKHADKCLIYDRPLPPSGLKWVEVASWWQEAQHIPDLKQARSALGKRLQQSVKLTDSLPELWLFKTYYEAFAPALGDELPALIPQVYLHYDPKTLVQRGQIPVLPRQRMDFLMLLGNGARIVLEIDGARHYSETGKASPRRYAEMAREDRSLRLRGYEVYRFGGAEFAESNNNGRKALHPNSRHMIIAFFTQLFRKHGVVGTTNTDMPSIASAAV